MRRCQNVSKWHGRSGETGPGHGTARPRSFGEVDVKQHGELAGFIMNSSIHLFESVEKGDIGWIQELFQGSSPVTHAAPF